MTMRMLALAAFCLASVAAAPAAQAASPDELRAARVARTYFSLLQHRRYAAALRLRNNDMPLARFVHAFRPYRSYRGMVGRPGAADGAAGSVFVEIPVHLRAVRRNGQHVNQHGTVVLRRINNVPGSSAADRRWHVERTEVEPAF